MHACTPDTLGPFDPYFGERLAECGGLALGLTRAVQQSFVDLPAFIPGIDGTDINLGLKRGWVAIGLRYWWKRTEGPGLERDLESLLNLDAGTHVLLWLTGNDRELERRLWPRRHQFLDKLERLAPAAVAGPAFSVWRDDPWLEQRYAIVRAVRFFGLLQERRVPAIPNVYWDNRRQLDDWIAWLNDNEVLNISMDLQCLSRRPRQLGFLSDLVHLRNSLPTPPALLIGGVGQERFIRDIQSVWPNSSFTKNVCLIAHMRRMEVARPNGPTTRVEMVGGDPQQLVLRETKRMESLVDRPLLLWPDHGSSPAVRDLVRPAKDGLWASRGRAIPVRRSKAATRGSRRREIDLPVGVWTGPSSASLGPTSRRS